MRRKKKRLKVDGKETWSRKASQGQNDSRRKAETKAKAVDKNQELSSTLSLARAPPRVVLQAQRPPDWGRAPRHENSHSPSVLPAPTSLVIADSQLHPRGRGPVHPTPTSCTHPPPGLFPSSSTAGERECSSPSNVCCGGLWEVR